MRDLLPPSASLSAPLRARLVEDFQRFRTEPLPTPLRDHVRERYGIEIATTYGGAPVSNPFGKASGQLSLQPSQVAADARAQLGFVVLKTVIAQDALGGRSMQAWATPETKMRVERIRGQSGEEGWTVTWTGRGWYGTLEEYCAFLREALTIGQRAGTLVVPSCKFHLPGAGESSWRTEEYDYTTCRLAEAWEGVCGERPLLLEKDFSPTLAGDRRSRDQETILEWVRRVPSLIRAAGARGPTGAGRVRIGLKLMNAMSDDDFQVAMLRAAAEGVGQGTGADWLVYANRLYDPHREFGGRVGVAYGGPDLSARNLRVLHRAQEDVRAGRMAPLPPISATGDILSGRTAVQYALAGASTFQMHTLFQLPRAEFGRAVGSRSARAMHRLLFDPENGYIAWMAHMRDRWAETPDADAFSLADVRAAAEARAAG